FPAPCWLSLPLLMLRVRTDNPNDAVATNDLTFCANLFYRRSNFHLPIPCRRTRHTGSCPLFIAIDDSASSQIIRRQLHLDLIARENTDKELPHLSRHVSHHFVTIFKFYSKHGIGQGFYDRPNDF